MLETAALTAGGVLFLYATGVGSPRDFGLGAAVMLANFSLIRRLVSRLIRPRGSKVATLFLVLAKFALLLGLVVVVFLKLPLEPMSFAAGATTLLLACVLEALLFGELLPEDPGDDGPV